MTNTASFARSSVTAQSWETYVEDGRETGEIHWLVQTEEGQVSGLWKIGPEEGAEFPYKPAARDTFHVIEGEAELETPDLENPVAVHEVLRCGLRNGHVRSVILASPYSQEINRADVNSRQSVARDQLRPIPG